MTIWTKAALGAATALALVLAAGGANAAPQLCHYVPMLKATPVTAVDVGDPALDAAAGYYKVGNHNLLVLRREGALLTARSAGQLPAKLYPVGRNRFSYEDGLGEVNVVLGLSGQVKGAVLHQEHVPDTWAQRIDETTARRLEARLGGRFEEDSNEPKTEPALRGLLDTMLKTGKPDYAGMEVNLQMAMHKRFPVLRNFVQTLGPVDHIDYLGLRDSGFDGFDADAYTVWQRDGVSQWTIATDKAGKMVWVSWGCGP